jgi:hypothetical protein
MRIETLGLLSLLIGGCGSAAGGGHVTEQGRSVYTSDVTRITLDDLGGGYGPPPPPGSQCTVGQAHYELAVADRTLAWDMCRLQGTGIYASDAGNRSIDDGEWTMLGPQLRQLVVDGHNGCGADKPEVELVVTTGAGALTYGDGFYGCLEHNRKRPLIVTVGLSVVEAGLAALASKN